MRKDQRSIIWENDDMVVIRRDTGCNKEKERGLQKITGWKAKECENNIPRSETRSKKRLDDSEGTSTMQY